MTYLLKELAEFTGPEWEQEDDLTFVTIDRDTAPAGIPIPENQPAISGIRVRTLAAPE